MVIKEYIVRVIPPEGHREERVKFHSPPGRHYQDESKLVEKVIEYLDKKYPWWDFTMVPVGRRQFNFVYAGLREVVSSRSKETQ